ncbi:MAG: TonB family protein [Saprospiraceae bacterium]|nr:TonB family protein [Saprospiraceae bacterium]
MKSLFIILLSFTIVTIGTSQVTAENNKEKEAKVVLVSNNTTKNFKGNSFEGVNQLNSKLKQHLNLPAIVTQEGLEGVVLVNVNLDAQGMIKKVKVVKGMHKEVDKTISETIRNIKQVDPIIIRGKAVPKTIQLSVVVE